MKKKTLCHKTVGRLAVAFFAVCLALMPRQAASQTDGGPDPSEKFSREELAQMVAPIALYPDALLSQILMASTYPIEVIEADRWVQKNPGLKDEALDQALLDKEWDPSVKAICHFPSILAVMSERISETTNLGNAFLAQEAEVMAMVQDLRAKARAQGHLNSTDEQRIIVQNGAIIIEPVNPRIIYVPYYDPFYIYGPWWYPAYPPYYWGPVGVRLGFGLSFWPGIYFGFSFGDWSYFSWHHHHIYVDAYRRPRFVRHDHWVDRSGPWHHVTTHRRGVAYPDKYTARKYGQYSRYPTTDIRRDTRGFPARTAPIVDSERRIDERRSIDRSRQKADLPRQDRVRQESPRTDRDRASQEQLRREQVDRARSTQNLQKRERVERVRPAPEQQHREQVEADRPTRQQPAGERSQVERTRQERQQRPKFDRAPQERIRVEREQPKFREQVFDRIDDGQKARQSSERGRFSRQDRGGNLGERGRPGGDNRYDRQNRERSR